MTESGCGTCWILRVKCGPSRRDERVMIWNPTANVPALVKGIEIVGEAVARMTEKTRLSRPDIPWEPIVGMRNRLVHAHFDINLDILWQTVQQDLPKLITLLEEPNL